MIPSSLGPKGQLQTGHGAGSFGGSPTRIFSDVMDSRTLPLAIYTYSFSTTTPRADAAGRGPFILAVARFRCWSGEVISVAFAIDCHDREIPASTASPRPSTGADIRTLMDRTLGPFRRSDRG